MHSSDVFIVSRRSPRQWEETCPHSWGHPRGPRVARRRNVLRVRLAAARSPPRCGGGQLPPHLVRSDETGAKGACVTPSGSFRRPVLCRIGNPARCRRSDGSRRITAVRTRSHRGRRGHRADSRPYAGRCRGNRWGTASCQRWRRRRNVHVVPNTSEESTSLSRPGCSSPPSRLSPDPHTVPAGTVRARPRRRPPSRSESSPRPPGAGVSAAAAHRPAPPRPG